MYHLTPRGHSQLQALAQVPPPPLMLPVPESVRRAEEVDKAKATKTREEVNRLRTKLLAAGYDVAAVPESELEPGAERTPVTNALLHWARTLDDWRARGQQSRAEAHEALYKQLVDWRQAEASRLRMAPASVLADHLAFKIALVKPQEAESLSVLGARITAEGAKQVVALIQKWQAAGWWHKGAPSSDANASSAAGASQGGGAAAAAGASAGAAGGEVGDAALVFPAGLFHPTKWPLAVPPAGKKVCVHMLAAASKPRA